MRPLDPNRATQYSVYRYPGGKSWLLPHIRQWMAAKPRPGVFIEPFAGGASASLCVALEDLADRVVINELDPHVHAMWAIIFGQDEAAFTRLTNAVRYFAMEEQNVRRYLELEGGREIWAMQGLLRNRVNHGGIMTKEAGMLKHGEDGKGILSRWNPEKLISRMEAMRSVRHRVTVTRLDGLEVLAAYADEPGAAFFIDPPYSAGGKKAGNRLYTHHQVNHGVLFSFARRLANPLMTYDNTPIISGLAVSHSLEVKPITMRSTKHETMTELLIGKDLSWHKPIPRKPRSSRKPTSDAPQSGMNECAPM